MAKEQKQPIDRKVPHYLRHTVDAETGCWNYDGAINDKGYGFMRVPGMSKSCGAHRYYYEYYVGPIPDGLVLDHLCRNTKCVNPDHLEPVTNGENVRRGEVCANPLSPEDIADIIAMRQRGVPRRTVAEKYGISGCHVSNICAGRRPQNGANKLRDDCKSVFSTQ